jgi:class 3 adenylate cyclase
VSVNIGDVIVEPHDIFGDGVNIAARLESIAEPGLSGFRSSRACTASRTASCSQREIRRSFPVVH